MKNDKTPTPCDEKLRLAVDAICRHDYENARACLEQAVSLDMENPEVYNLLGILYELNGDRLKAGRFYRVSYYMDQTFSAPAENLDRVGSFFLCGKPDIKLGLERIGGENI